MKRPVVVIVGGGFGGLNAAKSLKNADLDVVLIDKTNHHLFQPLLYQVASAALSPGDIANPIREILRNQKNVKVLMGEVISINKETKTVTLTDQEIKFDYLIVAVGSRHHYFGHNEWEIHAPGLKTIPDAIKLREKILASFEKAERLVFENHTDNVQAKIQKYLTFVLIGGGPTGVELSGSIMEISKQTMCRDFRLIDVNKTRVILLEAMPRILPAYDPTLSEKAKQTLEKMGVSVKVNTMVTDVNEFGVQTKDEFIETPNVIWCAGNMALPLVKTLNIDTDKAGRAFVGKDLTINGYPNIFVIGDAANITGDNGKPLPGVAQVAIQGGEYVAGILKKNIPQEKRIPFHYFDKGNLATIGRAKAIAEIGKFKLSGLIAWLTWSFVHIFYLIGFRNRYRVMFEWIILYFSRRNGIRLITYGERAEKELAAQEDEKEK